MNKAKQNKTHHGLIAVLPKIKKARYQQAEIPKYRLELVFTCSMIIVLVASGCDFESLTQVQAPPRWLEAQENAS